MLQSLGNFHFKCMVPPLQFRKMTLNRHMGSFSIVRLKADIARGETAAFLNRACIGF
jgi:hypothetical protein